MFFPSYLLFLVFFLRSSSSSGVKMTRKIDFFIFSVFVTTITIILNNFGHMKNYNNNNNSIFIY